MKRLFVLFFLCLFLFNACTKERTNIVIPTQNKLSSILKGNDITSIQSGVQQAEFNCTENHTLNLCTDNNTFSFYIGQLCTCGDNHIFPKLKINGINVPVRFDFTGGNITALFSIPISITKPAIKEKCKTMTYEFTYQIEDRRFPFRCNLSYYTDVKWIGIISFCNTCSAPQIPNSF